MAEILQYLKDHGEQLDSELATAMGISLAEVRQRVSGLSARGEVMTCRLIRFENGTKREGLLCRVAGFSPPPAPGRKTKGPM